MITNREIDDIFRWCTVTYDTSYTKGRTFKPSSPGKISMSELVNMHLRPEPYNVLKIVKIELTEENKRKLDEYFAKL